MKPRLLPTLALAGVLLLVSVSLPSSAPAQAGADPDPVTALIDELVAQQAKLKANQTAIDEKLATIAEEVRQARLFASRGGRGGGGGGGTSVGGGAAGGATGGNTGK